MALSWQNAGKVDKWTNVLANFAVKPLMRQAYKCPLATRMQTSHSPMAQ